MRGSAPSNSQAVCSYLSSAGGVWLSSARRTHDNAIMAFGNGSQALLHAELFHLAVDRHLIRKLPTGCAGLRE